MNSTAALSTATSKATVNSPEVDVSSVSGDIVLRGRIDAETVSGDINVAVNGERLCEFSAESVATI